MASKNVGNLNIKLSASTTQLAADLRAASGMATKYGQGVSKQFTAASKSAPAAAARQARAIAPVMSTAGMKAGGAFTSGFRKGTSTLAPMLGRLVTGPLALAAGAAGVGVSAGLGLGVTEAIKLAGQLEQTQVAFRVMTGDAQRAGTLIKDLRSFAAATPFTSDEVLGASRQLLAYGFSADEVSGSIKQLGDVAAALSIPMNDMAYLFGTLRAQGRAYTIDIRQFAMRGIPIWEELSKVMGASTVKVKRLVEDGKVGFHEVAQAFGNMSGEGGRFNGLLDQMGRTFLGQWNRLKDNALIALTEVGTMLINDTPLRGWIESGITGLQDIKEHLQAIKPEINAIVRAVGVWAKSFWTFWKQIAAGVRVAIDGFQAVFPEVSKALGLMLNRGEEFTLTWNQAKKNAVSFFDAATKGVGVQLDSFRALGGAIIDGFVIPFQQARIELIRMRAELLRNLEIASALSPAAKLAFNRILGKDDGLRSIKDEFDAAKKAFRVAENVWGQDTTNQDAIFAKLRAQARFVKSMEAIPEIGSEMAKTFELLNDPLKGGNLGLKERIELTKKLKDLEAGPLADVFANTKSSAERIRDITADVRSLQEVSRELRTPKYQNRYKDFFQSMRESIAGDEFRGHAPTLLNALGSASFTGGALIPAHLIPDTTQVEDKLKEFRFDPLKIPVELEERSDSLLRSHESALSKFRREFDQLTKMRTVDLIDHRTFALAVRSAFNEATSGLDAMQRRLPEGLDPRSSAGVEAMLLFKTFGPEGQGTSVADLLKGIKLQEARQLATAEKILAELKVARFGEFAQGVGQFGMGLTAAGERFGTAVTGAADSVVNRLRSLIPGFADDAPEARLPNFGGDAQNMPDAMERLARLERETISELKALRREMERIRRERSELQ